VAWRFVKTGEVPHHEHGHVEGVDEAPVDANVTVPGVREMEEKTA
jgi:C4-dicarboxylate transporter DctQ subunit